MCWYAVTDDALDEYLKPTVKTQPTISEDDGPETNAPEEAFSDDLSEYVYPLIL